MKRTVVLALAVASCVPGPEGGSELYDVERTEEREPCADHNPLRNAYFGDLHVHTGLSFDAYSNDVHTGPADAYRFAKGEPLALPPLDASGAGTTIVQLARALDFAAVTDHSEFFGEVQTCLDPEAFGYDSTQCATFRQADPSSTTIFGVELGESPPARFDFCARDGSAVTEGCITRAASVWARVQSDAEAAYDRSSACEFTSFIGYEWSGAPGLSNLHRNVIFRSSVVPERVTSYFDQPEPSGLWREVEADCAAAGSDCDVLMIPHNSNLSNGRMFRGYRQSLTSAELEAATEEAQVRERMEPVVEIFQHKGDSECMDGFSQPFGAPDELCAFEKTHISGFEDCEGRTGDGGLASFGCASRDDFVRNALAQGLLESERLGVNPFKLGIIASTDGHNGAPGDVDERTWVGHTGSQDVAPQNRLDGPTRPPGAWRFNPGGVVGVWAQENSRDALFTAIRRRETWGTSGPRIVVRFFGGWDLPENGCQAEDLIEASYERGVPMGRDLRPRDGHDRPTFVVSALRDPGSDDRPGTPLQRLQIIKGFVSAAGRPQLRVFDVATDGATLDVDPGSCVIGGGGADSLCAAWTDPTFDATRPAFYYARVVEHPSCRWSTWACNALPTGDRPNACDDPEVPKLIQERAWTSPIWYSPPSGD